MIHNFRRSVFKFSQNRSLPIVNNLKLYYPEGYAKQFKIPIEATTIDVVNLIKLEEQNFRDVSIRLGEKDYTNQSIPFLDLVLHNSPSIQIDNLNYSFQLDLNGSAPYFQGSELEDEFSKLEIPYFDGLVISRFHELFKENLPQNKQSFTPQEIETAVQQTLGKFGEENANNSAFWTTQQKILQNLDLVISYYEGIVSDVQKEAEKQGNSLLKKLIAFALLQYCFLLYLTYGLYDWSVSEPISYLLAQVMETVALFYFIKRGIAFKQSHLYKSKFNETFNQLINKKTNSTQFMRDLEFARKRANLTNARILYGTTSL